MKCFYFNALNEYRRQFTLLGTMWSHTLPIIVHLSPHESFIYINKNISRYSELIYLAYLESLDYIQGESVTT